MPCAKTSQERPETRAKRGPSGAIMKRETARQAAQERLKAAGAREGLSPALIREAQASLAGAFTLSDLLLGRRA